MLINRVREEEFGYLVFDDKGDSEIVKFEAKTLIRIGETIDAVTYRPTKVSATAPFHLKSPIIVLLEVTRKCDLTCGHCYISAGNPRENEMDTKAIYRVLDELKEREVFHVLITGGEPFLRDDIVDIINYAEECDFFVQVVTNGFSLTEKVLSQIKNNGHIRFALSYLGGLENGMSNDEALNHLKDKMTLLKKYNFPRMSWVSVTKLNIDRKPDIYKLCQDFGAKSYYQDVMPMGRCKENAHLLLDVDDVEKSVQLFGTGDADEEGDRPKTALEMCYLFEYLFQACKGGRSYAYICSNGDVYPCSNCAAEHLFCAGNVNESSFSDIWENSFKEHRAITWKDFKGCETCELREYFEKGMFCKLRCPPISRVLYNDLLYCGATEYTKAKSLWFARSYF